MEPILNRKTANLIAKKAIETNKDLFHQINNVFDNVLRIIEARAINGEFEYLFDLESLCIMPAVRSQVIAKLEALGYSVCPTYPGPLLISWK